MKLGKREQRLILSLLAALSAYAGWNFSPEIEKIIGVLIGNQVSQEAAVANINGTAYVERVIDGDTFELATGEIVRLIGIDAPESVKPGEGVQCFGKEASSFLRGLIEHQEIRLEQDKSETDRYGRLLRYAYLGDVLVNETLVREGYARAKTYRPDIAKQAMFTTAQEAARTEKRGLWDETTCPLSF